MEKTFNFHYATVVVKEHTVEIHHKKRWGSERRHYGIKVFPINRINFVQFLEARLFKDGFFELKIKGARSKYARDEARFDIIGSYENPTAHALKEAIEKEKKRKADEIMELYQLVQDGVLTEDEFTEYKKKALKI